MYLPNSSSLNIPRQLECHLTQGVNFHFFFCKLKISNFFLSLRWCPLKSLHFPDSRFLTTQWYGAQNWTQFFKLGLSSAGNSRILSSRIPGWHLGLICTCFLITHNWTYCWLKSPFFTHATDMSPPPEPVLWSWFLHLNVRLYLLSLQNFISNSGNQKLRIIREVLEMDDGDSWTKMGICLMPLNSAVKMVKRIML